MYQIHKKKKSNTKYIPTMNESLTLYSPILSMSILINQRTRHNMFLLLASFFYLRLSTNQAPQFKGGKKTNVDFNGLDFRGFILFWHLRQSPARRNGLRLRRMEFGKKTKLRLPLNRRNEKASDRRERYGRSDMIKSTRKSNSIYRLPYSPFGCLVNCWTIN